jgi:hypothetical protein
MKEPLIEGLSIDYILTRLKMLEGQLEDAGRYVGSNTVWLAQEAINELRKHQWTHDQSEQASQ